MPGTSTAKSVSPLINKKRKIFLYLSFTSLFIAAFLGYLFLKYPMSDLYCKRVTKHLANQARIIESNIFKVERVLEGCGNLFDQPISPPKYPIYVYQDRQLIYWSEHLYEFSYHDISGYFVEKCLDKSFGTFFIKKSNLSLKGHDYEIVSVIPLKNKYRIENEFLQTGLNADIFPDGLVDISLEKNKRYNIYNPFGIYLFSLRFTKNDSYHFDKQFVILFFIFVSLLFFYFYLHNYLILSLRLGKQLYAFTILIVFIIGIRALMIFFEIPYQVIEWQLFSPKLFASSFISPSLGDFFLNIVSITIIIIFLSLRFIAILHYKNLAQSHQLVKLAFISFLIFLSYLFLYGIRLFTYDIYFNSKIVIDITKEIDTTYIKLFAYLIFVFISVCYFLISHICAKLLQELSRNTKHLIAVFLLGNLSVLCSSIFLNIHNYFLFFLNISYLFIICYYKIVDYLPKSGYMALLYLFFCSLICAFAAAYSEYQFERVKTRQQKDKFADNLLLENDLYGEYLLSRIMEKVQHDQRKYNTFSFLFDSADLYSTDFASQKIRRIYVDRHFDKYSLDILFFNALGRPYGRPNEESYNTLYQRFAAAQYHSPYNNIRSCNDLQQGIKAYYAFIPLHISEKPIGYIVLNLKLRKITPNSIYPIFFVDKKYTFANLYHDYSYAIYKENKILYSYGNYNYDKQLIDKFSIGNNELKFSDFIHRRVFSPNGQTLVISSEVYPLINVFSNFSFLFLLLILVTIIIFFAHNFLLKNEYKRLNFSTRIQLYLNTAFSVPLFVVSIVTVSMLSKANTAETEQYYIRRALNVASELSLKVSAFRSGNISKDDLKAFLVGIAKYTQSDINLYGTDGRLLVTNQRYLFDNALLTRLLNPSAYRDLILRVRNKKILNEQIGSFNYSTAYVGIKSFDTENITGILGIPFFESKYTYDQKIIDVFTTILNIFTFILLILLVLLYFLTRSLTEPLLLLTQKIKKISLSDYNEPLHYPAKDEIGLLVGEYNKMLVKLEKNKAALARSEKQTAWREIAQQVAHEIKNPLTPMKLTIQQLQRVMVDNVGKTPDIINMLLHQIEILNDIATSFSSFAKMPLPVQRRFEISSTLHHTIVLYESNPTVKIEKNIPNAQFFVLGDDQMMGRIFNNLILNAIQSVAEDKSIYICISIKVKATNRVFIEFRDNGQGIPEEIQSKIFMPNFTTKMNGMGIGLAIAKRGIEHCGGNIWFETKPNEGTSFFIELPLYKI